MLSYLHRYHAGNFADIHKHLILLSILKEFHKKPAPFCVLDAFAGEGVYDLKCKEAEKNKEYLEGFELLKIGKRLSPLGQCLSEIAQYYQKQFALKKIYPGSPALIFKSLRKQDRAIFIEKHPQSLLYLKKYFTGLNQISIHKRDGLEGIKALLPFKERRGLVFIDPSYEVKDEYKKIGKLLREVYPKFSYGVYLIWYPILKTKNHFFLTEELKKNPIKNVWQSEWVMNSKNQTEGLLGSGIIVINIPWKVNYIITENFKMLEQKFSHMKMKNQFWE